MSETGTFFKADAVRFERTLPATLERVWELLTVVESLPGWYGAGAMEPYPGGVVNLFGGHVRGIVTQWQPPKKLVYTWNVFSPGEQVSPFPESYLTFDLAQRGSEILLILTHLPVLPQFVQQNAMGWHTFLDMIEAAARGETPQPRAHYMQQNAARYGVDLANLRK